MYFLVASYYRNQVIVCTATCEHECNLTCVGAEEDKALLSLEVTSTMVKD